MTHGQPDGDSSAPPSIPTPTIGAGSADLRTTSDDPAELRRLLELAQERLAFYESFDRIVGENVRRSGELMLERISLREQAEALAAEATRDRAERAAQVAESKETYRCLVRDLMREVDTLGNGLDDMQSRLRAAALALDPEAENDTLALRIAPELHLEPQAEPGTSIDGSPLPAQTATSVAMEAGGATLPSTAPETESTPEPEPDVETWDAPQVIELIAHGIPRAADALSLQRYLGGLEHVVGVVAREFAEGVLRLQITAQSPISADDIHGWPDHPDLRVLEHQATVIEIDCGAASA